MIRFLFRFVGLICLALGFIFLVYDGTKSIANHVVDWTTVDRLWNDLYSKSPQDFLKPLIVPFAKWVWDPVILAVLGAPVWVVLAVLGSIFIIIGRKKKPLIGFARR